MTAIRGAPGGGGAGSGVDRIAGAGIAARRGAPPKRSGPNRLASPLRACHRSSVTTATSSRTMMPARACHTLAGIGALRAA